MRAAGFREYDADSPIPDQDIGGVCKTVIGKNTGVAGSKKDRHT